MKYKKNRFFALVLVLFLIVVFQAPLTFAGSATLNWNANTESDLAGYKIYYGTSQRTGVQPGSASSGCGNCGYTSVISVGNVTSSTISNLNDGVRYYFSASAYDTTGNESPFSSEVFKDIPGVASNVTNITFSAQIEGLSIATNRNFIIKILTSGTSNVITQSSATTNSSGNLVFSSISVPTGTYDIIASSPNYLSKKKIGVSLASNNATPIALPNLLAGDLNNDNGISSGDWDLMSPYWFTNNSIADINKDGIVNSLDFGLMNKNWGQAGD